ncbi:hypothetical protein IAQ61_011675 [Plenodomus lingam]|uniref:25S rRNA (uridine-N(3))-methyltransferase BMT5-like domain-containing protein n=1 Tax=Leptosphaeria maculans (strain JN3 / isolate v23.1.3 / race Av1-4-5-6-7-8) TaxID=985895 RepID=E5AAS9_LEPMJ|nr:hypothetical protein LEMA_P019000.1 [Plenodomus lingam JN3]KAH9859893.1 hypothetical protein IAQ61_011675 [Plenodomus lingam]CBY00770.1 hypothetical protein LEMA_P019000.1 [Plenodomus lingam JN3]
MSKTKTKRARRELKRDGDRKIAAHHRKVAKAAETAATAAKPSSKPSSAKKQKTGASSAESKQDAAGIVTKPPVQASQKHAVPFGPYQHILLVGEGDFSFTRSLVVEHGCANVVATSFDTEEEVREKYPSFEGIARELSSLTPPVPIYHGIDATKLNSYKTLRCQRDSDDDADPDDADIAVDGERTGGAGKRAEGWDIICFQFPHTGGLSTNVNRQVRSNQALLVAFFKACLDCSTPKKRLQLLQAQANPALPRPRPFLRMGGKIIVTLFEGEPYTLWNIRDLARHAGLKVVESWKFDASQYPGYTHMRTLGAIEGGGGWRGEDRDARMYVFEKIPLVADEDEEKEMQKMARNARGGPLPSQKLAAKRAREEDEDEET